MDQLQCPFLVVLGILLGSWRHVFVVKAVIKPCGKLTNRCAICDSDSILLNFSNSRWFFLRDSATHR